MEVDGSYRMTDIANNVHRYLDRHFQCKTSIAYYAFAIYKNCAKTADALGRFVSNRTACDVELLLVHWL